MSSEDWWVFRAVVVWGVLIGTVYTAMDGSNYSARGRSYQPPQLAGCVMTWGGRYCRGVEGEHEDDRDRDVDTDSDSDRYAREW
jgi:hypothetical protein